MEENRRITRRSVNDNNAFIIEPNNGRFGNRGRFQNRGRGRGRGRVRGPVRDRGQGRGAAQDRGQGRGAAQDRGQGRGAVQDHSEAVIPENAIHNNNRNHNAAANEPENGHGNGVDVQVNAQENDVQVIPANPPAIRQDDVPVQEDPDVPEQNNEQRDAAALHQRDAPNDVERNDLRQNNIVPAENPVMLQNHNAGNQIYYPAARGGHQGGGYKNHKFYNKYDPYKDNRVHLLEKSVYHLYKTVQETSVKLLENKTDEAPSNAITRSSHSSESTTTERHVCPTASTASLQIATPQMQIASMYPQMYMPPQQMVVLPPYLPMMPPTMYTMPTPVYQMPPPPIPPLQMQAPGMIPPYSPYTRALTQGWNPFHPYY